MKLVVVGGVAGGASVAARARRLDEAAEIIVFERGGYVSFANCGLPYHIGGVITDRSRLLLQTPESLNESLGIDVRVSTEVTAIDPKKKTVTVREVGTGKEYTESYDKLALCQGADPLHLPLPGIDLPGIHVLRNITDMDEIKQHLDAALASAQGTNKPVRTVVIGAGYIGLEMAENLRHRGAEVTVVELSDQIMPPLDKEVSIPVEQHIRGRGVELILSTAAAAFQKRPDGSLRVELNNGKTLDADLVIMSAGVRPNTGLAVEAGLAMGERGGIVVDTHMKTSDPNIWAAGDAVETDHTVLPGKWITPLAGPANREARVAAENICGRDTEYLSTQGTSIVKVFEMTAGGTGATERQLERAGVPYRTVHVHPSGHAGYYPGTAMMHIKLLFSPEDGKVLGAQIAGFDGVDKRLDVFATAIRLGAKVHDLETLELAYAPPFGSAKDPVNMAGFVATNVFRGDLNLWYAKDFPETVEGARIIDVRTPEEYDIWHIPGAESVPLGTMRAVVESWDKSVPIRLYCAVGFRSYLAYRLLVQRGFEDVKTLSGGSHTFRFWHDLEPVGEAVKAPEIAYAEAVDLIKSAQGTGAIVELDCTGLACPGPIMKLAKKMDEVQPGDDVVVHVSDPGFAADGPAWASTKGHELLAMTPEGPGYVATFRKGGGAPAGGVARQSLDQVSFVVFSGDMDKVLAAFIIANGALAMGQKVSMFFTFWGLNALRRQDPPKRDRKVLDKMFGMMMPSGPEKLPLSTMNMAGMGPAMIKKVMEDHSVQTLPELMQSAREDGARLIGCTMTMDLLGIAESDLLEGIELGGVATFLGEAQKSGTTLFI
ncbi:FAD-dependent oxidoreductase [Microbacterium thalassium]|uniref:NADPH-dependent 2,4-dienoyl-CoA reductase/sulfur reductase-like enzyme/peroxiredoxin family protein/rhodanese-related sulfurtransferase/TusA-related sulfurtransferase n=1 Tax=Microbacterium thalassium TaxID=362649 RepID=A0A7X0KV06_9MICO|nr:FAD-dependent oxidoreductase [Microbacterium thalassium]MBB6391594.1 NADPH-dependent 2,4-dienoyl-CoA reductase/sulfur reductase-like enzyme/peroxiredoxin family protein/rhodanese-related sulfurtransferase/TusA-related sulfurtransferase [Microbacterium thalassium]GLK24197.1 pyridine nucleotide-disulfide oxidoreductase [Microbacterium thalassium]